MLGNPNDAAGLTAEAWGAYSGSKTDRRDAWNRMLEGDPPPRIAALCREGLVATNEPERSKVCEAILIELGEDTAAIR